MRKQDYIIQLIKAMSPSERRYFKLYSSIESGEKKYLQLFDLLETKDEYDTAELAAELNVSTGQLGVLKHYLTDVLFTCLRTSSPHPLTAEIYQLKDAAHMLARKRLFEYSIEVFDEALKLAWEMDRVELIPEIAMGKLTNLINLRRDKETEEVIALVLQSLPVIAELTQINDLWARAVSLHKEGLKTAAFDKLMKHPLLKGKAEKLKSFRARMKWYNIWNIYYRETHDKANALKTARAEIAYYEKNPRAANVDFLGYVRSFTMLAHAEERWGNYEEALQVLKKLKDFTATHPGLKLDPGLPVYIDMASTFQLRYLKRFNEALALALQIEPVIHQRLPGQRVSFLLSYALSLFFTGHLQEATARLDEIIRMKDNASLPAQRYARAVMLMLHLRMGNNATVPYFIKSSRAWMKRKKLESSEIEELFSCAYSIAMAPKLTVKDKWNELNTLIEAGKFPDLNHEVHLEEWIAMMRSRSY